MDNDVDKMLDAKASPVKYLEESHSDCKSSGLKLDKGSGLKVDKIVLLKVESDSDQDTPLHEMRVASYVKDETTLRVPIPEPVGPPNYGSIIEEQQELY